MVNTNANTHGQNLSQGTVVQRLSEETYKQVLDLLFPMDVLKDNNFEFAWVLRFSPSEAADSQIIIIKRAGGIEVTESLSLDGNVYAKLTETLERTGSGDAVKMAKQIRIRKRVVSVRPSLVQYWLDDFARSVNVLIGTNKTEVAGQPGTGIVFLHGTSYDLKYEAGAIEVYYSVLGPEIGEASIPKTLPLERWMNGVRREIKRLPSIASR